VLIWRKYAELCDIRDTIEEFGVTVKIQNNDVVCCCCTLDYYDYCGTAAM